MLFFVMMNSYDVRILLSEADNNGDGDDKDNDGHAISVRHVWGGSRP